MTQNNNNSNKNFIYIYIYIKLQNSKQAPFVLPFLFFFCNLSSIEKYTVFCLSCTSLKVLHVRHSKALHMILIELQAYVCLDGSREEEKRPEWVGGSPSPWLEVFLGVKGKDLGGYHTPLKTFFYSLKLREFEGRGHYCTEFFSNCPLPLIRSKQTPITYLFLLSIYMIPSSFLSFPLCNQRKWGISTHL